MIGIVDGDDIGVDAGKRLAAALAHAAGNVAAGTLHRGGEDTRKRMLPGAVRPAEQVSVAHAAGGKRTGKATLDRVVAGKAVKTHRVRSFPPIVYFSNLIV